MRLRVIPLKVSTADARAYAFRVLKRDLPQENPMCWQSSL
jgi:hypothetical protein